MTRESFLFRAKLKGKGICMQSTRCCSYASSDILRCILIQRNTCSCRNIRHASFSFSGICLQWTELVVHFCIFPRMWCINTILGYNRINTSQLSPTNVFLGNPKVKHICKIGKYYKTRQMVKCDWLRKQNLQNLLCLKTKTIKGIYVSLTRSVGRS